MTNQDINKLANGSLPKWPQMLVTGKAVTVEQAKEIIFRTDEFLTDASTYSGGNARKFNVVYRKLAGLDMLQYERTALDGHKFTDVYWDKQYELRERLKIVKTTYVENRWASSSFIGGPHGWCSPDGVISYSDNVGKWPSIEEIIEDWTTIAQAFPYLDLHVTLMSGESCEDDTHPVINIRVVDGNAFAEAPDITVHDIPEKEDMITKFVEHMHFGTLEREIGLPMEWYGEFAGKIWPVVIDIFQEQ